MNKLKKIIILLFIVLVIIIILVILMLNSNNTTENENLTTNTEILSEETPGFVELQDHNIHYTINNIIENYVLYIKHINGDEYVDNSKINMTEEELRTTIQTDGLTAIKNLLDNAYTTEFEITDNDIIEKQMQYMQKGDYTEDIQYSVDIERIYTTDIGNNITLAIVYSKINDVDFNFIIKLDFNNNTYSLYGDEYIEKYSYNENTKNTDINISNSSVPVNEYNTFTEVNATDAYIASQYFSTYKTKMLQDPSKAFELLNEEYRQQKFGNFQEFEEYINSREDILQSTSLYGYIANEYDGVKEYICLDQNNNYYIFTEDANLKYNVILDTYTIDLPEFTERYNSGSDQIKVGLNLEKVFAAINDGDYEYVYNKLDSTFRQNNFPTLSDFENYIKENLYTSIDTDYGKYETSGDLHIYEVNIKEKNNENSNTITKNFIMQLGEGTDFVMSFNV